MARLVDNLLATQHRPAAPPPWLIALVYLVAVAVLVAAAAALTASLCRSRPASKQKQTLGLVIGGAAVLLGAGLAGYASVGKTRGMQGWPSVAAVSAMQAAGFLCIVCAVVVIQQRMSRPHP